MKQHRNIQVFGCRLLPESTFPLKLLLPEVAEELEDKNEEPLKLTEVTPEKPIELVEMKPIRKSNVFGNCFAFFQKFSSEFLRRLQNHQYLTLRLLRQRKKLNQKLFLPFTLQRQEQRNPQKLRTLSSMKIFNTRLSSVPNVLSRTQTLLISTKF